MRINNNLMAMNTHRQLGINANAGAKSIEKLSSGYRINRAGDDAAGLAISEKMRAQVRGLTQASRNAQDGISLIQTAEGALNETHAMLQRMRELTVQANNDTNNQEDRDNLQDEMTALIGEITAITQKTEFNGKNLLSGNLGVSVNNTGTLTAVDFAASGLSIDVSGADSGETFTFGRTGTTVVLTGTNSGISQTLTVADTTAMTSGTVLNFDALGVKITLDADKNLATGIVGGTDTDLAAETFTTIGTSTEFQIGANANQTLTLSIGNMDATALGVNSISVGGANYTTFNTDIAAIDNAIKLVSSQRSSLGANQNRLEHTIKNLDTSAENLQASESRIRDVDMAKEMMNFTKNNILQQAAQAMLAQANQAPQGVLQLLR